MNKPARNHLAGVIEKACLGWRRPLGPIARRRLATRIIQAGYRHPDIDDELGAENRRLRYENAQLREQLRNVTGHDDQPILTSGCPGWTRGQDGRP